MLYHLTIVMGGAALGGAARYLISTLAMHKLGITFPYGTLIVNLLGCFIIGLFTAVAFDHFNFSPQIRLFVLAGFLGGLTTFSSFCYETIGLFQAGNINFALGNIALNTFIGLIAVRLGTYIARIIFF
ncbi:fluoride efflux transporter CrcB [Anaerosinus gibii]|uniref:Fluoride-specific ion channel FluC n=1 Tax=Selenobaculum gibii TaxID=3054208 RepID=A0A9Y2ERI1_9FIRM|nr:fluoride efflux transporter CrcB [Selenobaculum gbiensis]WIW71222.1 fluoride efflux transporter CrcB [Selenobaculum gbiensis]